MAMPTFDCARWATPLLSSQTDALSSLVARARSESQRAKRDYEESRQVLCELQHRVETSDGRRQRDTRRMIKLETAAGLSSDLHRLVGTLAWQERRCAPSTSKPPAVPGTLAWYRALHSAPASEPAQEVAGENVAGRGLPGAVKAKVNKVHVTAPPCHFVAAGAVSQAKQAAADGMAEQVDGGAQSDTESDTCSEASETSSSWSGSAAGSNDEEARSVQTTGTARDAGDDVQQLGGSSFGTAAVADLACAESSPRCSRPNSPDADPSCLPVDLPSAPLRPVVKNGQVDR